VEKSKMSITDAIAIARQSNVAVIRDERDDLWTIESGEQFEMFTSREIVIMRKSEFREYVNRLTN
jgi:hypothetical protein